MPELAAGRVAGQRRSQRCRPDMPRNQRRARSPLGGPHPMLPGCHGISEIIAVSMGDPDRERTHLHRQPLLMNDRIENSVHERVRLFGAEDAGELHRLVDGDSNRDVGRRRGFRPMSGRRMIRSMRAIRSVRQWVALAPMSSSSSRAWSVTSSTRVSAKARTGSESSSVCWEVLQRPLRLARVTGLPIESLKGQLSRAVTVVRGVDRLEVVLKIRQRHISPTEHRGWPSLWH